MAEQEHDQVYLVRVPSFGDPDVEREKVAVRVARALHHQVKPGCSIVAFDLDNGVRLGDWRTLDPFGDDMGNHGDAHPEPLVPAARSVDALAAAAVDCARTGDPLDVSHAEYRQLVNLGPGEWDRLVASALPWDLHGREVNVRLRRG